MLFQHYLYKYVSELREKHKVHGSKVPLTRSPSQAIVSYHVPHTSYLRPDYSSSRMRIISTAALATEVPGPKMAATPAW